MLSIILFGYQEWSNTWLLFFRLTLKKGNSWLFWRKIFINLASADFYLRNKYIFVLFFKIHQWNSANSGKFNIVTIFEVWTGRRHRTQTFQHWQNGKKWTESEEKEEEEEGEERATFVCIKVAGVKTCVWHEIFVRRYFKPNCMADISKSNLIRWCVRGRTRSLARHH